MTIIGPQLLGTIRIVVSHPPDPQNWSQIIQSILLILFSPLCTYGFHLKMAFIELKLKLQPNNMSLVSEKETLKKIMNMHVKLELGLETVHQLVGQTILLLLAYTNTPTHSGLKTMFDDGHDPMAVLFLFLSMLLSLKSCVTSHWKALTACREHFPFKCKLSSGLFCLFGCLTRVTAIIIFFTGPLGLFSLLRHLQAEQYPWHTNVLDLFYPNGTLSLDNGKPFELELIDRWTKNGSLYLAHKNGTLMRDDKLEPILNPYHLVSPPDYTYYTGIGLQLYLLIFFIWTGIHMSVIFMAKSKLSSSFWNNFNILEKIIHCLENANIPYNGKEWDDEKGDAKEHRIRMKNNWFEGLTVILINGVFNLVLLIPLVYLGKFKFRM